MDPVKIIHAASQHGYVRIVEAQLRHGRCDVDAVMPGQRGETPLFVACMNGHHDVADLLINYNANVDHITEHGTTALFAAVRSGNIDLSLMILRRSVSVDDANFAGLTPLILATAKGYEVVVRALVEAGASTSRHNIHGMTPVIAAASGGFVRIMNWLIREHNAPINGIPGGVKAITKAARRGHTHVIEVLVHEHGAMIECGCPLRHAAGRGHLDTASSLITLGAFVDSIDGGETAICASAANGYLEVTKLLVEKGATLARVGSVAPLHAAASKGRLQTVKWLLDACADVNEQSIDSTTAIYAAAAYTPNPFYWRVVLLLVTAGAVFDAAFIWSLEPRLRSTINRWPNDTIILEIYEPMHEIIATTLVNIPTEIVNLIVQFFAPSWFDVMCDHFMHMPL